MLEWRKEILLNSIGFFKIENEESKKLKIFENKEFYHKFKQKL
jgi:hypothetical protein